MVVIECPHCDEDLEMDDGAHGLFECPYCGNDYEWGEEPSLKKKRKLKTHSKVSTKSKITNTKKINSRTKTLDSKTKLFERRGQTTRHEKMDVLEYGGYQVSTLFATFAMLMLIFTGLNSGEWYTADWSEEYDYEEREWRGLSQGTGYGTTMSFGTSEIIIEEVRDTKAYASGDTITDGEEYEEVRITGIDYSNMLILIDAEISSEEDYCKDSDNAWGQTEEEFEEECDDSLEQLNDQYDWYNSWDNAGTVIKIFMIISLIFCLLIFSIKTILLLQHVGVVDIENKLLTKVTMYENMLSAIMAGIVVFGLILYWFTIPDFNHLFRLGGGEEPDDYSYGLGMIWWLTMITSLSYIAISVVGIRNQRLSS